MLRIDVSWGCTCKWQSYADLVIKKSGRPEKKWLAMTTTSLQAIAESSCGRKETFDIDIFIFNI